MNQTGSDFAYRFDWDEKAPHMPFLLCAGHGVEISSAFGNPDDITMNSIKDALYTSDDQQERYELADSMPSYWAALAYHDAPGNGMLEQL